MIDMVTLAAVLAACAFISAVAAGMAETGFTPKKKKSKGKSDFLWRRQFTDPDAEQCGCEAAAKLVVRLKKHRFYNSDDPWADVLRWMIYFLKQIHEGTPYLILTLGLCPTPDKIMHGVKFPSFDLAGRTTFKTAEELRKCASSQTYRSLSDWVGQVPNGIDFGNHGLSMGHFNGRMTCERTPDGNNCLAHRYKEAKLVVDDLIIPTAEVCRAVNVPFGLVLIGGPNGMNQTIKLLEAKKEKFDCLITHMYHMATMSVRYHLSWRGGWATQVEAVSKRTRDVLSGPLMKFFEELVYPRVSDNEKHTTDLYQYLIECEETGYVQAEDQYSSDEAKGQIAKTKYGEDFLKELAKVADRLKEKKGDREKAILLGRERGDTVAKWYSSHFIGEGRTTWKMDLVADKYDWIETDLQKIEDARDENSTLKELKKLKSVRASPDPNSSDSDE